MITKVNFNLNNKDVYIETDSIKRLIDVLREDFKFTGVKEGCGEGECGACSVIIDGKLINSCLVPIGTLEGSKIITIDGYRKTHRYEIIKNSFEKVGAVQCGFCIPGMIMATEVLLSKKPRPSEADIREGISGNLCRCTGYNMIVEAISLASNKGDGLW
ncbi:(2Fe-2S)-binding protein [Clostridium lacusfryxellense]|uniref:(2Fe-2S)-binding protein n=1 Tax=Clostridium lacusfryxellense TaxID=205328 RepID=UPI001C0E8196|nr:(2Fe-2S)-binding protein [Clostridium lacusfryxellense]MBU3113443.1 (2Fe-2S)-binding protein [Clostridium lacusfryxellense]